MPFSGTCAPDFTDAESYIRFAPGQVVICNPSGQSDVLTFS